MMWKDVNIIHFKELEKVINDIFKIYEKVKKNKR